MDFVGDLGKFMKWKCGMRTISIWRFKPTLKLTQTIMEIFTWSSGGRTYGRVVDDVDVEGLKRFEFTWSRNDECDPASVVVNRVSRQTSWRGEFSDSSGDDSTQESF